jgi:hypothetical protein
LQSLDGRPAASHALSNRLEELVNLLYLVRLDRKDPKKVLEWVNLADAQLQQVAQILQDHFNH